MNAAIMMIRRTAVAAVAAVAALAMAAGEISPASAEQIFKCVGGDGRVEFATRCAPGAHKQETGIDPQPGKGGGRDVPQARSAAELELEFQKRQADRRDAEAREQKAQAAAEARGRQCAEVRRNLATTSSGRRLYTADPTTGERVYMTPEDVAQASDKSRNFLQNNCN